MVINRITEYLKSTEDKTPQRDMLNTAIQSIKELGKECLEEHVEYMLDGKHSRHELMKFFLHQADALSDLNIEMDVTEDDPLNEIWSGNHGDILRSFAVVGLYAMTIMSYMADKDGNIPPK